MDKLQNTVNIFGLINGQYTLVDIKQVYRRLASVNHPDKGGNTETMQLINTAFEELCKHFANNDTLDINQDEKQDHTVNFAFIQELKAMTGVIIEVCGYWVWLTGNTYPQKRLSAIWGLNFQGLKKPGTGRQQLTAPVLNVAVSP